MDNKKTRQGKTTRQQYNMYLEELRSNESFRTHKFNVAHQDILEENWNSLTKKLNCCGGPQRTIVQWKKIFTDWKSSVRKKARLINRWMKETGGGPPEKPMNDLEEALIDLTGKVVVEGLQNVGEMGSSKNDQEDIMDQNLTNQSVLVPNKTQNVMKMNNNEINSILIHTQDSAGQHTPKMSLKRRNVLSQETEGSSYVKKRKGVLLSSVQQLVDNRREEDSALKEINENLKILVELKREEMELKRQEIYLLQTKLQIKYNISFETEEE